MKVKVCGMRDSDNIRELLALAPDFMGFIFYDKSLRFVGDELDADLLKSFPRSVKKVGVFVNASPDYILRSVKKYDLQYVQLHGNETPDFCRNLRNRGISIIKAFAVDESFNFSMINNYKPSCDFFLFDAKGDQAGGNGITFDWGLMNRYDNEKPFFISGGIDAETLDSLEKLKHLKLYGVDINSKVELSPGLKDTVLVKAVITGLKPIEEEETVA
ncbi:phosphoribosylanthranilate isomerase [Larkinella arboricola]|uniref:N-(5'-phosphoribosyl)anthranilate isomerase n=1 Tax=Larkinella arboricola TaxID=643671 RepID=A0A327WJ67_LARAB|nr:phosphoribosylanthranilate isomerase [Larkinella arboricola]RAJ89766.1 phosphoribosylanthranilate isomerase [Larkinella arboricola]